MDVQLNPVSKGNECTQRQRILVVDDHVIFRKGVISLIETHTRLEVIGEASNGSEGVELARKLEPDTVLMDVRMPGLDGFETTKIIKKEMPWIKVIILTVLNTEDQLFTSIEVGADGYIPKSFDPNHLFEMIEQVRQEETALPASIATKIVQDFCQTPHSVSEEKSNSVLSAREYQVLKLIADGATNNTIAAHLDISENTVKNHVRSILEKLSVRNRIQAAVYAVREGII